MKSLEFILNSFTEAGNIIYIMYFVFSPSGEWAETGGKEDQKGSVAVIIQGEQWPWTEAS